MDPSTFSLFLSFHLSVCVMIHYYNYYLTNTLRFHVLLSVAPSGGEKNWIWFHLVSSFSYTVDWMAESTPRVPSTEPVISTTFLHFKVIIPTTSPPLCLLQTPVMTVSLSSLRQQKLLYRKPHLPTQKSANLPLPTLTFFFFSLSLMTTFYNASRTLLICHIPFCSYKTVSTSLQNYSHHLVNMPNISHLFKKSVYSHLSYTTIPFLYLFLQFLKKLHIHMFFILLPSIHPSSTELILNTAFPRQVFCCSY